MSLINFGEKRKASLRGKAERIIEFIVQNYYAPPMLVYMDSQGYDTTEEEVIKAQNTTRNNLMRRYVEGRNTKDFSGIISELKQQLKEIRDRNKALMFNQLAGAPNEELSEKIPQATEVDADTDRA